MFKNILVPDLDGTCNPDALRLSVQIARMFEGHVLCLHVRHSASELGRYIMPTNPETAIYSSQLVQSLIEADRRRAERSRRVFDAFCARERLDHDGPVTAAWREGDGNVCDQAIQRGYYHDMVVLGRPSGSGDLSKGDAADILVNCGRPVLLAPAAALSNPLSTVVIGWKESAPAAKAVAAALPLLAEASTVHILGVAERSCDAGPVLVAVERLAAYLRSHGLAPQSGHVVSDDRDPAEVLLEAASERLHGGLLVMGAYAHSRAREFVFGGFTRHVLRSASLPVLLAH